MEHPDRLFLDFQSALAGRYSLEREVGRGGMGVVYLAREVRLDRPVAIKLLPPSKTADPKLRERFLREARTAAKLSHPNVISIHAVEETGGFVFFAMAYVEGETLTERVRRRGPPPACRDGSRRRSTAASRRIPPIVPTAPRRSPSNSVTRWSSGVSCRWRCGRSSSTTRASTAAAC